MLLKREDKKRPSPPPPQASSYEETQNLYAQRFYENLSKDITTRISLIENVLQYCLLRLKTVVFGGVVKNRPF